MMASALWPSTCGQPLTTSSHRIRVQIASAAFPRFARNPGTGEPLALATRQVPAVQDVFHDPAHPTNLTLPVVNVP
jgi:predicted acyl esterase